MFDLFIQRWLSALRLDSDILDNLQNVVGKNFACSYISILDQIITGCQTCDGIRACTCSRVGQILCNFRSESLCFGLSREGLRLVSWMTKHFLTINNSEYDYHTLVKVAEMAGLAGFVGFHESEDGYIVSFPDTENTQALINDYKARLRDLENNIWQY